MPRNEALFVLLVLFMIFSNLVPLKKQGSFQTRTGEVISADAPLQPCAGTPLADSGTPATFAEIG
jgi:hypothetical protein